MLGGLVGWILGEGMQVSWKMQLGLFLVPTALYGVMFFGQHFPKSEASAKGLSVGEMLKDVGILGALVACFLIGLFFKDQLGGILGVLHRQSVLRLGDVELPRLGGRRSVLLLVVGVKTNFSVGSLLLFVLFIDARARRRGGARHRRLDPEHHRQHPDAGAGQDPVRVHVAADVLAALLRRLHREAA